MDEIINLILDFISPVFVWGTFLVLVTFFVMVSWALSYHWKNYSINKTKSSRIMRAYYIVSFILIGIMFISAITFSL